MLVAGADAYRLTKREKGWVAVLLEGENPPVVVTVATLTTLLANHPNVAALGVDIPIGLPPPYPRPADEAARRFVGPRRSSVFPTPLRQALAAATYEDACRINEEQTGKRLSKQTWELREKILEAEAVASDDPRIFEIHPEVSFCECAGAPLQESKLEWNGFQQRRALLAENGIVLPERVDVRVPVADVIDAAIAAWSARRYAAKKALLLPAEHATRIGAIWR